MAVVRPLVGPYRPACARLDDLGTDCDRPGHLASPTAHRDPGRTPGLDDHPGDHSRRHHRPAAGTHLPYRARPADTRRDLPDLNGVILYAAERLRRRAPTPDDVADPVASDHRI